MIGLRRPLGLAIAAVLVPAPVLFAQDARETFAQGVELLQRGRDAEALQAFQRVLALDPSQEDAYELFHSTEHQIFLDMLVREGEFELVARRLMGLAELGRKERRHDPDAIRALLGELEGDDVLARVRATRTLAADHGEYAVKYLIYALADQDDDDRRVVFMQVLTNMGGDVVLPLVEALSAPDPFLRRNVALTLGHIGDPRANGALATLATGDADEGVRSAASDALAHTGGTANPLGQLLELGTAYHAAHPSVLQPHQVSDVLWHWEGNGLVETAVPAFLYNEELAKKCFFAALRVAPGSTEALAGIARASAAERAELAERAAVGQDVSEWIERLADDDLALQVAGSRALDLALLWSLEAGDQAAATGLCRALGLAATAPTQGLRAALTEVASGAIRGEAAVALGRIAYQTGSTAAPDVVAALAGSAGREVLNIAAVIDADDARRNALAVTLGERGVMVNAWNTGAKGLAGLRRVSGVDVILVAETLPDLTFAQVADEVRADPRLAGAGLVILAEDGEAASGLWGDRIAAAISKPAEVGKVDAILSGSKNSDRQQADDLAARSAAILGLLAGAGRTDVGAAADALAGTLAGRPDPVTVPAMGALASAGSSRHVDPLTAVVADGGRSDAARVAAGDALAGIFARHPQAAEATLVALNGVATSREVAFSVRRAVTTALGRLDLSDEIRAGLVHSVRARVATGGE